MKPKKTEFPLESKLIITGAKGILLANVIGALVISEAKDKIDETRKVYKKFIKSRAK